MQIRHPVRILRSDAPPIEDLDQQRRALIKDILQKVAASEGLQCKRLILESSGGPIGGTTVGAEVRAASRGMSLLKMFKFLTRNFHCRARRSSA